MVSARKVCYYNQYCLSMPDSRPGRTTYAVAHLPRVRGRPAVVSVDRSPNRLPQLPDPTRAINPPARTPTHSLVLPLRGRSNGTRDRVRAPIGGRRHNAGREQLAAA